jgi:hypothetical protein
MDAGRLKGVFLVHGELERAQKLSDALLGRGIRPVKIPVRGEKAEFNA